MSKMEEFAPTAGGDAPVIEATKTDRIDDSTQSTITIKPEYVDTALKNVVTSVEKNQAMSMEVNAETNTSAKGVADFGTETINTNAKDPKTDTTTTVYQPQVTAQSPDKKKVKVARFEQITYYLSFEIITHTIFLFCHRPTKTQSEMSHM